jgi:hypothetical protein
MIEVNMKTISKMFFSKCDSSIECGKKNNNKTHTFCDEMMNFMDRNNEFE